VEQNAAGPVTADQGLKCRIKSFVDLAVVEEELKDILCFIFDKLFALFSTCDV